MKVFITGATGFFGSRLVRCLLEKTGHELVLLTRRPDSSGLPDHERVSLVRGDVTDPPDTLARHMEGCEGVIHSAALVSTWARDRSAFDRVNIEGTLGVLRAAGMAQAGKILYTSSFLALGSSADKPLGEDGPHFRELHFNDYERTKYIANLRAQELAEREDLPLTTLYPTVMYGPGPLSSGNLVANLLIDYMKRKLPARLGDGTSRWNYVFVEDVAEGHLRALEKSKPGDRFILGGENVSTADFFRTVERVTGISQPRLSVPFPVARLAGACEEILAFLTGREPKTTRGVIDIFRRDWVFDSSLAERDLGYRPLGLEQGLKRTVDWIRAEGLAETSVVSSLI
ncbi:MAG: NAD-dependent epimerase/dehydratase family protein [Gemmatimonadota bacterium]|nr:NAD-dependent epimerase/dehydratase family protein [Gemmatimonadota bacterium]